MNKSALLLVAIFSLMSVNANALTWLSADQVKEAIDFLPVPPQPGSDIDKADIQQMLKIQADRESAPIFEYKKEKGEFVLDDKGNKIVDHDIQCGAAAAEADLNMPLPFVAPLGPMTPDELKKWADFGNTLYGDIKPITKGIKSQKGDNGTKNFNRVRPFLAHPEILHTCNFKTFQEESSNSYPSGHATNGELYARIFAHVYPRRGKAFMERGKQYGLDRVIGGVHHPSDVEAGRKLGDKIFELLMQNPEFQKSLDKIDTDTGL